MQFCCCFVVVVVLFLEILLILISINFTIFFWFNILHFYVCYLGNSNIALFNTLYHYAYPETLPSFPQKQRNQIFSFFRIFFAFFLVRFAFGGKKNGIIFRS
jgi:hypothetical protein